MKNSPVCQLMYSNFSHIQIMLWLFCSMPLSEMYRENTFSKMPMVKNDSFLWYHLQSKWLFLSVLTKYIHTYHIISSLFLHSNQTMCTRFPFIESFIYAFHFSMLCEPLVTKKNMLHRLTHIGFSVSITRS